MDSYQGYHPKCLGKVFFDAIGAPTCIAAAETQAATSSTIRPSSGISLKPAVLAHAVASAASSAHSTRRIMDASIPTPRSRGRPYIHRSKEAGEGWEHVFEPW
jgi:hypothetical protein